MPIGIIFITNIVFFILTAMKIVQVQKEMNYFHSAQDENGKHQSRFNHKKCRFEILSFIQLICNSFLVNFSVCSFSLYMRLLIVMGVTWSVDAIAFVSPDNVFFLISDICNALQGAFIFSLFVLKPRVLNLIQQRFVSN